MPRITVFTPTFNRAEHLHIVYDSLVAQTFRDFEWLIVDGGSDATPQLVEQWRKACDFDIRYLRQVGPGLHAAYNEGARAARGEFYLSLHSDDGCVPEALAVLMRHWNAIPVEARLGFAGVWSRCMKQDGRIVGPPLERPHYDTTYQEMIYALGFTFEMWPLVRTDVMRAHPYPEIEGIRFIPEGYAWRAIGARYRHRVINEPLRVYRGMDEAAGSPDQLTAQLKTGQHALAMAIYLRAKLEGDIGWFPRAPVKLARAAASYTRHSMHSGLGLSRQWREIGRASSRALWAATWPVGMMLYLRDRVRVRGRRR